MERISRFFLLGLVALAFAPVALAQELITTNRTFDANIDEWATLFPGGGTIAWTPSQGQPPGALRFVGDSQIARPTDCYQLTDPGLLTFSFDGFMETTGDLLTCSMNFRLYTDAADCTGPYSEFVEGFGIDLPDVAVPNQWEHLVFELPIPEDPVNETGVMSYHPVLFKSGDLNGDDFCVFDNVSLFFAPTPVTAIPTMNEKALAVLAALLALAAVAVLRRKS